MSWEAHPDVAIFAVIHGGTSVAKALSGATSLPCSRREPPMRFVDACVFGGLACALSGCTGLAFESEPGGHGVSASLSSGGIAVDPRTETTFVLGRKAPAEDG